MYLLVILALPFVSSLIASLLPAQARKLQATLAGTVAAICALMVAWVYPQISAGHIIESSTPWVPAHGLSFTLRMDGLAWLFSFIITSMGALIALYAHYYLSAQDPVRRFFSFLQAFMGSMLGVVLSGNLIQMVVFWELTSLSSFMLIAYWYHRRDARRGARMSLLITGTGGIFLLAGMLMLGQMAGSYELGTVLKSGDQIRAHAWYPLMLLLVSIGALSKSAQFPFHIWLPQAMAAPTPVSAYLHSATMVKAGVFLLARLWPVLAGTTEWAILIGGAGLISLTMSAYNAMFQRDMKGVLAYSTISHLGLITLLLGLNSPLALVAALFHIMNHATFKASLFMAAGIVDHETGTRNMNRLSGLRHAMPITATLAMVAAAAMAGVPLLNGFISKEMFFSESIIAGNDNTWDYLLPLIAVVAGSFSVAYSLRFIREVFFGPVATDLPRPPHEPPLRMLIPSGILVLTCLMVGIAPALTFGPFLATAARSIMGDDMPFYSLHIWHGFNLPLLMSLIATVAGVVIVWLLARYYPNRQGRTPFLYRFDGRHLFEVFMEWLEVKANALLDRLYSPRLQRQILLIFFVTMLVTALPLTRGTWLRGPIFTPIDPYFLLVWVIGGACAIGAAYQAKFHRPASLLLSGGAGLATCLTFAWVSAPDLALTQLTVEVVTLVLILLGLRWLPPRVSSIRHPEDNSNRAALRRCRDLLIAMTAGLGVSLLAYSIMTRPPSSDVASFFVEKSLPLGGGANVVNVILVDFRGFDTFGEITVLGIVALTVFALLRRFRPPVEAIALPLARRQNIRDSREAVFEEPDPDALLPEGIMRIPAVLVRLLLPIATLISLYFLLRGHNLPGGGFVAGLIMATAIILQYMVGGVVWMESRPLIQPQTWIATGMLSAGAAAMMVWFFNKPFLAAQSWDFTLPFIGTVHTSSALLFDIGVYLLVIGSTVLMLIALAHQSLRFYRKLPAAHAALTAKQEQL